MKYVALLSGGKDSCFNLVHCALNGHELVAAASLRPAQGKEELDSYLYQTVGQDAIELVSQALGVPLYRKFITGSAVEQGSEYGSRKGGHSSGVKGDETEDLYQLLSDVKTHHPYVQGVSVGAILSNYQRVRVEHVCLRLSLTPLCYLWQRDQDELLSEMITSGVEAILIKVAGIGLKPRHLGQTLAAMQPTLRHLNELYGAHICGEGGEYETLTLDCPLFKRRIILKNVETIIHSDNDFATVAYLRIKDAFLADKEIPLHAPLTGPPLLFPEFQGLETLLKDTIPTAEGDNSCTSTPSNATEQRTVSTSSCKLGNLVAVSNVQGAEGGGHPVSEEVASCFKILQNQLSQHSLSISVLAFVNIFISDMTTFPEVNEAYKAFFGTSPPARACVAVDLPAGINVRLDCIAYEDRSNERRALHVQGLSYWAPANIGPYSQAIVVNDKIFISGQIGMQPSNLALPSPPNFTLETSLAFQHMHRILTALKEMYGMNWRPSIQSLICWLIGTSNLAKVQKIGEILDSYTSVPTLYVGAKSLPKGAQVEAQIIAHTGQYVALEDGETEVRQCKTPIFNKGELTLDSCTAYWEVCTYAEVSAFCAIIAVKGNPTTATEILKDEIKDKALWNETYSVRLFHRGALREQPPAFVSSLFRGAVHPAITAIPVAFIATRSSDDWEFALCLLGGSSPTSVHDN